MKLSWSVIACTCLVSACASSRPDHFYVLTARLPAVNSPRSAPSTQVSLTVTLPSLVDRPELVVNTSQNGVRVLDHERWAAPLPDLVGQTLGRDLENRRSDLIVADRSLHRPGIPTLTVTVEVGQVATRPGTELSIEAHWRIADPQAGTDAAGSGLFTVPLGTDHSAVPQAFSDCLDQLADQLIKQMRAG